MSERMSGVDQAWLRMDGPTNRMMIVGVWILDGAVDRAALERRLVDGLLRHDRFRQCVVEDTLGHAWRDDPDFDLDNHLVFRRLPRPAGPAQLRAFVGRIASEPLDPRHPLWRFDLVENYAGTQALVIRIHHCIADGIALVRVALSICDDAIEAGNHEVEPAAHSVDSSDGLEALSGSLGAGATQAVRLATGMLTTAVAATGDAEARRALFDFGTRVTSDALKIALMTQDSPTSLKGRPEGRKAVAWNDPLPLDEVKAVCKVLGVSVNDVLLSCVAGAVQRYLESRGEPTHGKDIRAMVPVNLRGSASASEPALGNRFGLVPLMLPVGISNPVERLYEVRRRMEELKGGYQGVIAFALLEAAGLAPAVVQKTLLDYLAHKGSAVMTNVPGPARPLKFLGRRVAQVMFWVPQSGTIGLGVSIFSYDGGVQFGVMADAALCDDPQAIVDAFAPEFDRLLLTLSMLPKELVEAGRIDGLELERRLFGESDRVAPPSASKRRRVSRRSSPSRA